MNNRKYKTNPEELLKQGKEIMSSSDEAKYHFRVFAVNRVLSGTPASQVGGYAGYTAKVKHFFLWYGKQFFLSTVRRFFSLR